MNAHNCPTLPCPICRPDQRMIELQLQRLAWLETATSQIRDWRSQDERNGQPWDNSSREAGSPNKQPASNS
jgi:hypothetical protein